MKVEFKDSEGNNVVGILSNPTESSSVVILAHGFTTSKDSSTNVWLEKEFNQENIAALRIDLYGHGESEGNFEDITISKAVDDILSAIDFVKRKGFTSIGLMGSSFGGMASILAASKSNDLKVLALKCPVSDYITKLLTQKNKFPKEIWKEQGFIMHKGTKKLNYSFFEMRRRLVLLMKLHPKSKCQHLLFMEMRIQLFLLNKVENYLRQFLMQNLKLFMGQIIIFQNKKIKKKCLPY